MIYVVFGGQFGSEGKASVACYLAKTRGIRVAIYDGGPNSGHTSPDGSVWRNLPSVAPYVDRIYIGPRAVISHDCLWREADRFGGEVYIHHNAAYLSMEDPLREGDLVGRISSTGSGTGSARARKYFERREEAIIGNIRPTLPSNVVILSPAHWLDKLWSEDGHMLMECSQGVLLDADHSPYYPYVTSRSTTPWAALAGIGWKGEVTYTVGVFRRYPIRTGGPSGPTGGNEIQWADIGVVPERATVTGRVRRLFNWSHADFMYVMKLTGPDMVAITHMDYEPDPEAWLDTVVKPYLRGVDLIWSKKPGEFI